MLLRNLFQLRDRNLESTPAPLVFLLIILSSIACDPSECADCTSLSCNPQAETVKKVNDGIGIVSYDSLENKWAIHRSASGYDSQDVGLLCEPLAEEYQEIGKFVVFSGEYKKYSKDRPVRFPGETFYYLFMTSINTPKDEE
ncbi:hypothetical protein WJR50_28805 [Catalinimonas sp. 4WD22]|uniref:hypothetical protein n=1 Tax=Catalinimonas locisalis TaxID=3133978 RepID=UPI003101279E